MNCLEALMELHDRKIKFIFQLQEYGFFKDNESILEKQIYEASIIEEQILRLCGLQTYPRVRFEKKD